MATTQSSFTPRLVMPHTLVVVMLLVILVLGMSWVIPSGEYQRQKVETSQGTRNVTVAGTYHQVEKVYLGPQMVLESPIKGFMDGALLICFLLMIGGSFAIFQETGAVEFGIRRLTAGIVPRPYLEGLLIPVLMIIFSLAGSIFGMSEEVIPFILIFIPLARRLGYDSIVGVSIPFLGAAAGFAAAFFNPFTVGISQSIAGIPLYSGLGYRLVSWVIGTAVIIAYVMWYARKVKRNPELSPVYDLDREREALAAARRRRRALGRPPRRHARPLRGLDGAAGGRRAEVAVVHRPDRGAVLRDGHRAGVRRRPRPEPRRADLRHRRQGHGGRRVHHRLRPGAARHRAGGEDPRHDALRAPRARSRRCRRASSRR